MKISRILTGAFTAVLAAVCMAFTVSAETEDIEMSVARAVQTNGAWGQSITYSTSDLNPTKFTPDTTIRVEYELEGEPSLPNQYQVELILQNYVADPPIWAQVVPIEYDDTYAVFDYDAMVLAYGSDDFSGVNNICIGDRGIKAKVTKVTVTNLDVPEVTTTTTQATETEAVTEAPQDEAPAETTTAAPTAEEASGSGISMTTIIIVVIVAAIVVAGVVVTIIVVNKNKKRFY